MTQQITHAETDSSSLEIKDESTDTPLAAVGSRRINRIIWGFAATTQILNPTYLALNDHVLISRNMTGASEEEIVGETETQLNTEEGPISEVSPPSIGVAEIANRDRLELLARAYVAGKLSPEEDARLAIVTERVRRLIPRVTAEDFEQLQLMAEELGRIETEDNQRRHRLGLL